jgi:hypothetical protein
LPTLDRPQKATSGRIDCGNCSGREALRINSAARILGIAIDCFSRLACPRCRSLSLFDEEYQENCDLVLYLGQARVKELGRKL